MHAIFDLLAFDSLNTINQCVIPSSVGTFGTKDPCEGTVKYLAVQASGCKPVPQPGANRSVIFDFGDIDVAY